MELQRPDLKAIFSEALECRPEPDRIAYLDQACGNNPEPLAQVERLLDAHERAEGFSDHRPERPPAATQWHRCRPTR